MPSAFFSGQIRISAFWRKWYYFVVALLLTCGVGALHYLLVTPIYQVSARILVEERGKPLGEEHGDREDTNFLPTHAQIISSPAVLNRAVERMSEPPEPKPDLSPVEIVQKRLEVEPLIGTRVLSISYQDAAAGLATEGLNLIIESYKDYLNASEKSSHEETIVLLTERSNALREEIRKLQSEYQDLRRNSPLLGEDHDSASIQRGMLTRLSEELMMAKSRRIAIDNQLQTLLTLRPRGFDPDDDSTVRMIAIKKDDPEAHRLRAAVELLARMSTDGLLSGINIQLDLETLLQAELEYAELRKSLGARHPDVLAVEERIAALTERLQSIVDDAPQALRQEAATLERQEQHLAELYQREFTHAKAIDESLVRENQKMDEIALVKLAHDTIVEQLNELSVADRAVSEGRASVSVRILDGPELSDELLWPQPIPLAGLCGLSGLIFGAIGVVLSEKMNRQQQESADENDDDASDNV